MFIELLVLPTSSLARRGRKGTAGRGTGSHLQRGEATHGGGLRKGGGLLPSTQPWPSPLSHHCRARKAQPQPRHAASGSSSILSRRTQRRDPALKQF